MKIAIISDSHDNIWNVDKALAQISEQGAELLLHCGDLCAPFVLDRIGQRFEGPVHVIFGNNDGDGRLLQTIATRHKQIHLHGIYAEIEAGDVQLAMIHYPEPARRIAQSGIFGLVCYGHNHQQKIERIDETLLVNPGELLGLQGAASWALYDSSSGECELQMVEPASE
jgi:uncharacterized protein